MNFEGKYIIHGLSNPLVVLPLDMDPEFRAAWTARSEVEK